MRVASVRILKKKKSLRTSLPAVSRITNDCYTTEYIIVRLTIRILVPPLRENFDNSFSPPQSLKYTHRSNKRLTLFLSIFFHQYSVI